MLMCDWSGVMFLSDSHSDGTHSLQRHWWVKDVIHISDDLKEMFTPVQTLVFSRCWLMDFLSDSHSDGTHSPQSIHRWDTDAVLNDEYVILCDCQRKWSAWSWSSRRWRWRRMTFSHTEKWFFNRTKKISKKEPSSRSTSARSLLSERL